MRIIKLSVSKPYTKELYLGVAGENNVTQVQFDVSPWIAEFGNGEISLLNQRSVDASPYYVDNAELVDSSFIWTISSNDCARSGIGHCNLLFKVNSTVKKSIVFTTLIENSLGQQNESPEEYSFWLDKIVEDISDVKDLIPVPTTEDNGKVIGVNSEGNYELIENGSSGGSISPSTSTPSMDGIASTGTEEAYARGDHIHPNDTSRVSTNTTVNGKSLANNITLTGSDIDIGDNNPIKIDVALTQASQTLDNVILDVSSLSESKLDVTTNSGILKSNGTSSLDIAVEGVDYVTPDQIPTAVSELTNDSNFITSADLPDVSNFVEESELATVAKSGSYADLSNKPTIPPAPDLTPYATKAELASVATTGDYADLSNKPTIPSLNGYATEQWVENKGYLTEAPVTSVNGSIGDITGLQTINNLVTSVSSSSTNTQYPSAKLLYDSLESIESSKQATLVSGTNIKTINNQSLLGEGNIDIQGGSGEETDPIFSASPAANITINDINKWKLLSDLPPIGYSVSGGIAVSEKVNFSSTGDSDYCNTFLFIHTIRMNGYKFYRLNGSSARGYFFGGFNVDGKYCSLSAVPINKLYVAYMSDNIVYLTTLADKASVDAINTINGLIKANGSGTVSAAVAGTDYQAPLVSGTNIKTINNQSLLGSGNITIESGSGGGTLYVEQLQNQALSVTYREIVEAIEAGASVIFNGPYSDDNPYIVLSPLESYGYEDSIYWVCFWNLRDRYGFSYTSTSEDGVLTLYQNPDQ